jgi:hypothetical protein
VFLDVGAGQRVAVRNREAVTIVELATDGAPPKLLPLGFVTGVRFSEDGHMLAGIGSDGRVMLADTRTGHAGAVAPRLRARERMMSEQSKLGSGPHYDKRRVVFSGDGSRVLVLDSDGALQRSRALPPTAPAELRDWVRTNAPRLPASATLEDLASGDDP